jgi:hypothetical protein
MGTNTSRPKKRPAMTAMTTQSVLRGARGMGELPDQCFIEGISGMRAATGRRSSRCHAQNEENTRFLIARANSLSPKRFQ